MMVCPKIYAPIRQSECCSCSERTEGDGCRLTDDPPLEDRIAAAQGDADLDSAYLAPRWAAEQVLLGGELQ